MSSSENIQQFWESQFPEKICTEIDKLQGGGSERQYYRVHTDDGPYIVVHNMDVEENTHFIELTEVLSASGTSVAQVRAVSDDGRYYTLEDLGDSTLLSIAMDKSTSHDELLRLYEKTIDQLIRAQAALTPIAENLPVYGYELVLHDIMYFLYDFVKVAGVDFDPSVVLHGISDWAEAISEFRAVGFMYRDFQGRNVMVKNNQPFLIDFQGGMFGPLAYDMSSLLYQAKAGLSRASRNELWAYYKLRLGELAEIDARDLDEDYRYTTLLRLLQVLGAYGYRGLIQGKEHFTASIVPALHNLRSFIDEESLDIPAGLHSMISAITEEDFIQKFQK